MKKFTLVSLFLALSSVIHSDQVTHNATQVELTQEQIVDISGFEIEISEVKLSLEDDGDTLVLNEEKSIQEQSQHLLEIKRKSILENS